jgi:MoxR-like ATPase
MDLNHLSKSQLNEVLRRVTGRGRDLARHSKGDLVLALDSLPEAAVGAAVQSLGLITGAWSGSASAASEPVATAVEQLPHIAPVATKSLGEIFGIRGKHASLTVEVWNDPAAPALDPLYKFEPEQLSSAVSAIKRGRNVWLAGPAGTGKTEFVKNVCAGLGRAFVRVSFDSGAERYEFIGGERVKNGSTVYQQGVVLRGMTRPGAVVLLDEVSFARPEYLSALHAVLEPEGCVTIPETGEIVRKAPGVVFFAADNSNGRGDFSGMYVGVREMNVAFVNRFAKTLVFSYLDQSVEAKVIAGRAGCTQQLGEVIVNFLTVCRQAGDQAQLDHVPTLREAFYLAEALTDGQAPRKAFEECMVNRASPESQEVLQQLWRANVSDYAISEALDGRSTPDPLQQSVEQPTAEAA